MRFQRLNIYFRTAGVTFECRKEKPYGLKPVYLYFIYRINFQICSGEGKAECHITNIMKYLKDEIIPEK